MPTGRLLDACRQKDRWDMPSHSYSESIVLPNFIRHFILCSTITLGGVAVPSIEGAQDLKIAPLIQEYCTDCHDDSISRGDLDLNSFLGKPVSEHPEIWETVITRLRTRQMPPKGKDRPNEETYGQIVDQLESIFDTHAASTPNPGNSESIRRLNRTEYQNAIRDLLGIEMDASSLLPQDEASHGFDNITVGELSPTLLSRYIRAAEKISRLAVGTRKALTGHTVRIKPDITQEEHVPGLPIGTRGGALIKHTFPAPGEYDIRIRLARDRNEHVEGLSGTHELEVLLNRNRMDVLKVSPPKRRNDHTKVDAHLKTRIKVAAGPQDLGITFIKKPSSLIETKRQPLNSHFNYHRHPRLTPAVYEVSITGPYVTDEFSPASETPSRKLIFTSYPENKQSWNKSATKILNHLVTRAYRRQARPVDLKRPMEFFEETAKKDGFEAGIEMALSAVLVSPEFIFRIERTPAGVNPGDAHPLASEELATRLSFFLWSSIPDSDLLETAINGQLKKPEVLMKQVKRMLNDPRSESLVSNFAGQWLRLRNLDSFTPDARSYPDFDDNLRQAMRRETELFLSDIIREDRSLMDLLKADYTYLNERLAKHYKIPHIQGSRFRRVALKPEDRRGGLLRHASVLTVTSYATRTSPVLRGNWILETILGTPTPPPPDDVPSLEDNKIDANLPVRELLQAHRAKKACAVCHDLMDPIGFSLENYDPIGQWRTHENGVELDATGGLPDGLEFTGVVGLENGLLQRPELFAHAFTEKLMTFALGRGVEHQDAPAIRKIVREAAQNDYRISSIILGITDSIPFKMRQTP